MLLALAAVQLCAAGAYADEVCRFTGTTDFSGYVTVTTDVAVRGGVTSVDVKGTFESKALFWPRIRYLAEEVSSWRSGELQNVAVNSRYLLGEHIVRQQWDNFHRDGNSVLAYRVQAKTLADFRRKHMGFVQHWDPETFGKPWLPDYEAASPERRADLDLEGSPLPRGLRSPLAMAFYWIRWLPAGGQDVPVFLPGFKTERLVVLPITAALWAGGTVWQAPLRYSSLSERPVSSATAWMSTDRHLLQLAFELHERRGSARGLVSQDGCNGTAETPAAK